LNNLRSSPEKYIALLDQYKETLEYDEIGAYIKFNNNILHCSKNDLQETRDFLSRMSNRIAKTDTIMWNEKLQQVGSEIINTLKENVYVKKDLSKKASISVGYDCELIDFMSYHYLDPSLSVLAFLMENPTLKEKLLCENYHFGVVSCGTYKPNAAVTIILLANQIHKTVKEEDYFEIDLNEKIFDNISYRDKIKDGVILRSDGRKHVINFTLNNDTFREETFYFDRKQKK